MATLSGAKKLKTIKGDTGELRESSSFRDNRGYVFWREGLLYRRISREGMASYDALMESGLYEALTTLGLLVAHRQVESGKDYIVLQPDLVRLITYPYEWSFSQLRDAALATLLIQKRALERSMTLRDASAYNIQFVGGSPLLIDTLSFDLYREGDPWIAYQQFCQHFLAPLALMSYVHVDLLQLGRVHLDGIPLGLAAGLLPARARLKPGIVTHIMLHAKLQKSHAGASSRRGRKLSKTSLLGLIDSLERTISSLRPIAARTTWGAYYDDTNYSEVSFEAKGKLVAREVSGLAPERVLDLGANNGHFSRLMMNVTDALIISCDSDPRAIEANYTINRSQKLTNIVPVLADITNPSPAIGWANTERRVFAERMNCDVVVVLALVHHLAISSNVPLEKIAAYLAALGPQLVIEFVPKEDSKVQMLLSTREDIFNDYHQKGFEEAFGKYFEILRQKKIPDTHRLLYTMGRKLK